MKARLLKVNVQAVLVVEDDDGGLEEVVCDPVTVAGKQWASFRADGGGFDQALDTLTAQIEGPPS